MKTAQAKAWTLHEWADGSNRSWPEPLSPVAANTTMLVGTNDCEDARPSGYSAGEWGSALFRPYCGGVFVPGWGTHGAFVLAGHGGHTDTGTVDVGLFDFADYTWKCLLNTNGAPHDHVGYWTAAETDGSPYYAVADTDGQCPPPHHSYRIDVGVGSAVISPLRAAILSLPLFPDGIWQCALNYSTQDCTWSRISDDYVEDYYGLGGGDEGWQQAHYDAVRGRVWFPCRRFGETNVLPSFRPGVDSGWSTQTYSGMATAAQQTSTMRGNLVLDTTRDCFWCFGANGQLYRMDLDDPPASLTWTTQTSTNLSTVYLNDDDSFDRTRWHEYPEADGGDGCFYTYTAGGTSVLKKFDPETRVFSFKTIDNGPTMKDWESAQAGPYTRFFYVPSRKCFAWIPDPSSQVFLLRP